ncbi:hypothetical protein [Nocardia sienata]|uniref:hypothetical protein n=1 Tax=Nocardia sienata TaxID=248552 RepID=UPI0007A4BA74|nr:hypothetical protein [Nocardia sienata]
MRPQARRRGSRLLGAIIGAVALVSAGATPAAGLHWTQPTPVADTPSLQVGLHSHCEGPVEAGHLPDGTTAYCSPISNSGAFAWSYYSDPLPVEPNNRPYTCDNASCEYEDGSTVPGHRCGMQCAEPPTTGDLAPHLAARP